MRFFILSLSLLYFQGQKTQMPHGGILFIQFKYYSLLPVIESYAGWTAQRAISNLDKI